MPSETAYDLTAGLRGLGGGRVWSLMISLFGDLAQGEGDTIQGPVLSAIMAALDVRPEAARVALHRLRNDGWITSTKMGRISHHGLTPFGRLQSAEASPRIYSTPDDVPKYWQLILLETPEADAQSAAIEAGFVQILPRVFVGAETSEPPQGAVALQGTAAVPDWLRNEVTPAALREEYALLEKALSSLCDALPLAHTPSPTEIAVLRCLVVHNWRRLVLKHPVVPSALSRHDAPAHKCHVMVADLLARFPRPTLDEIEQDQAG
ncbi:MAG: PaaX family transcriptional regulator C-terminal domain-containing protein [Sulfitobacter sp.]